MEHTEKEEILKKILDLKLKRQTPEVKLEIQTLQQKLAE
jgi:hypothetical protein